jgi:hypothetical protein
MGIMGSFLDSNFSLDVVTESPWDDGQPYSILPVSDGSALVETRLWCLFSPSFAALPAET